MTAENYFYIFLLSCNVMISPLLPIPSPSRPMLPTSCSTTDKIRFASPPYLPPWTVPLPPSLLMMSLLPNTMGWREPLPVSTWKQTEADFFYYNFFFLNGWGFDFIFFNYFPFKKLEPSASPLHWTRCEKRRLDSQAGAEVWGMQFMLLLKKNYDLVNLGRPM